MAVAKSKGCSIADSGDFGKQQFQSWHPGTPGTCTSAHASYLIKIISFHWFDMAFSLPHMIDAALLSHRRAIRFF